MLQEIIDIHSDHTTAKLYTYFLENTDLEPDRKRPVVLICPGGGYEFTSDREAEPIALQMLARGFHACVLRYSVKTQRFPTALWELAESVAWLKKNEEIYHIAPGQLAVCGFSAGGHLAASLGVFWNHEFLSRLTKKEAQWMRPDKLILSYPVITAGEFAHIGSFEALLGRSLEEETWKDNEIVREFLGDRPLEQVSLEQQVTADMPPVFLWHMVEDGVVPVENALLFAASLRRADVSFEMHLFPAGGHGLSLASRETSGPDGGGILKECQSWMDLACGFLERGWNKFSE